ncbi:hypothetical protein PFISCL1PPCAC_5176, partial [Pristionchus fissidentatus]
RDEEMPVRIALLPSNWDLRLSVDLPACNVFADRLWIGPRHIRLPLSSFRSLLCSHQGIIYKTNCHPPIRPPSQP